MAHLNANKPANRGKNTLTTQMKAKRETSDWEKNIKQNTQFIYAIKSLLLFICQVVAYAKF